MKSYSSYKRVDPVYFSGEIFFPVGLLFAAEFISYFLLYFLGLGFAVFFNAAIAWCGYFFYFYYGKSHGGISLEFLFGFVLVTAFLLFVDYGVYALVNYQKTGEFNGLHFLIWLTIVLGSPTVYYIHYFGSHYRARVRLANRYFKSTFSVYHDRELLMHIDSISFVNSSKYLISDIKLENNVCFYSEDELAEMDIQSKYYHLNQSAFSGLIHIPFNADKFEISWFSIVEDKYYKVSVPFPIQKLELEEEKYPLDEPKSIRGKKSKRIYLHIYQNGGLKLYSDDLVFIDFTSNDSVEISQEEKEEKLIVNRSCHNFYNNEKRFSQLIEKIKKSNHIQERFEMKDKLVVWGLEFSGLDKRNYLEINDNYFKYYKIEKEVIAEPALRHLPKKIIFVHRGSYLRTWMRIHVNIQKLNQKIEEVLDSGSEKQILFSLDFKDADANDLVFTVTGNTKKVIFSDWEIEIDEYRKKEINEEDLEKKEDETKRALLKEGWDFMFAKNYEAAQKNCDAILAIDSQYASAYFLESRILWYTKGYEASFSKRHYYFTKTEHEPPVNALIYNNYGCILDIELRYEESLSYFEKAIEINPKEPIFVCNLGEMYYKLKQPEKALKEARRAKMMGYESAMLNEILANKGKIDLINQV
ncbi:tetratricopeptide repeat protein [Flavobacterium sp.]|uniref:tetratricopeptide repeat protein n=1 Tax=Flavobacterium sp. TaxID=239 RepID=UPI0031DC4883